MKLSAHFSFFFHKLNGPLGSDMGTYNWNNQLPIHAKIEYITSYYYSIWMVNRIVYNMMSKTNLIGKNIVEQNNDSLYTSFHICSHITLSDQLIIHSLFFPIYLITMEANSSSKSYHYFFFLLHFEQISRISLWKIMIYHEYFLLNRLWEK